MSVADLQALLDRAAIKDVLVQYCRAVDRRDLALLKDVYWPDATDDHGFFTGNGHAFAEWNVAGTAGAMRLTQHYLTNFWCRIDGDAAEAESYVLAFHKIRDDPVVAARLMGGSHMARHGADATGGHDLLLGGQWFDRLERRDGAWRIARRVATTHWDMSGPGSAVLREGVFRAIAGMTPAAAGVGREA